MSNSGLYWIVTFQKKIIETVLIHRFTSHTLSRRLYQITICSDLLLINDGKLDIKNFQVNKMRRISSFVS